MNQCKYCGFKNLDVRQNGPHMELYCTDCGKHQAFVKQEHNIETGKPASEKQYKYALNLLEDWELSGKLLTKRQAGAIISAFGRQAP